MINLDALEAAAKAATPGEWRASTIGAAVFTENHKIGGDRLVCEVRGYGYLTGKGHGGLGLPHNLAVKQQRDTATFIALANPVAVIEMVERMRALEAENARLKEAEAALAWFHVNATDLKIDIRSAHFNRGGGATQWMREEDRDFRADLEKALERARADIANMLANDNVTPDISRAVRDAFQDAARAIRALKEKA